jgi:hypothetical protein
VISFFFLLLSAGCGKLLEANSGVQHEAKESQTGLLAIGLPLREMCPAEYQAGVAQMGIAKGYLEKAENKCGSHRSEGIASIDQTFFRRAA